MRTIAVPFYGYVNSSIKRLRSLKKLAQRRSLHISNQDEVGTNVIAVDALKRKLLYAKKSPDASSCLIVDLNHLEACSLQKEYKSINAGELKTTRLHHFLKSIFLHLVFKNGSGSLSLQLFDAQREQQGDLELLEAQAKKWESIVSKLLPVRIK